MRIFGRKKKSFDVARGVVDGKEITYSFTKPLAAERAQREFKDAVERGLPSGSVIIIP